MSDRWIYCELRTRPKGRVQPCMNFSSSTAASRTAIRLRMWPMAVLRVGWPGIVARPTKLLTVLCKQRYAK
jgi:hypothetical protein